eukprot:1850324-Alexandrium_andersonii.AAC.1
MPPRPSSARRGGRTRARPAFGCPRQLRSPLSPAPRVERSLRAPPPAGWRSPLCDRPSSTALGSRLHA